MADHLVVDAGELGVEELLAAIDEGRRVTVRTARLGSDHEVTLRRDGDFFYCDTPTRLHKHETRAGMRECLEEQGYARA